MESIPSRRPNSAGDANAEVMFTCDTALSDDVTVAVRARDVTMWAYGGDFAPAVSEPEWSYLEFKCPYCFRRHVKRLTRVIFEGLRGVVRVMEIPAEAVEPHDGSPISYDDVLEFHLSVEHR